MDSATAAWCSSLSLLTATTSRTARRSTALRLSDSDSRVPQPGFDGLAAGSARAWCACQERHPVIRCRQGPRWSRACIRRTGSVSGGRTTIGCVGLLALIAGTVSYLHMHLLVELHGQPG